MFSSRRDFLTFSLAAGLAGQPKLPLTREPAPKGSFTILHLSDTHVCQLDGTHPNLVDKRQPYDKGFDSLRRILSVLPKRVGVEAVVITGDMVDSWEIESPQGSLRRNQVERFAAAAKRSPVPLWLTLGNHDIRTLDDDPFGHLWDVAQLYWLENELDKTPDRKAILFFHIPLPVADTNADGVHFREPPKGWPFPDRYQRGMFKILNEHPSVVAAFVGHNHENIIEEIPLPSGHQVTQVETGAFAVNNDYWRVIEIGEHEISISKPGKTDVEKTVRVGQ